MNEVESRAGIGTEPDNIPGIMRNSSSNKTICNNIDLMSWGTDRAVGAAGSFGHYRPAARQDRRGLLTYAARDVAFAGQIFRHQHVARIEHTLRRHRSQFPSAQTS